MRIGFTAKGTGWDSHIDARFGRARFLLVFDDERDELNVFDNTAMAEQQHGAGPGTAKKLFDMKANVLITGNGPGDNAANILKKAGIEIFTGAEGLSIEDAYKHYTNKKLIYFNLK